MTQKLLALALLSGALTLHAATPEKELTKLMQEAISAWDTLDANAAAPYYAKDPNLVYYDISPLKYTGWNDYYKHVNQEFADYKSYKIVLSSDAEAHLVGDSFAWGTATWKGIAVKKNNAVENYVGRWTVLFQKRAGKWLIVHEHLSTVDPPAPKPVKK